jgi:NTP pyrophosphatase (non-canonical NTP hydrolase)
MAGALHEFHEALGDVRGRGNLPLRAQLHDEEHDELIDALVRLEGGRMVEGDDRVLREAVARELADVLYIAYGTAHALDLDLDLAFERVHAANMAKLGGPKRDDGKLLKPDGWQPPDMTGTAG